MMDNESERSVWDWEVLLVMGMLVLLVVDVAIITVMVVDGVVVAMVIVTVVDAVCCCFGDFIPHRPPP